MVVDVEWVVFGVDLQLEVVAGRLVVDGHGGPVLPTCYQNSAISVVPLCRDASIFGV